MAEENTQAPKTPELNEIATIARSLFVAAFGRILRPDDDTLATRGGAKGIRIYREIERDAHAFAVLQKRKLAIVARPWDVDPASESPADEAAAELIRTMIAGLQFDRICLDLLDAGLMGYAVCEVLWEVRDGLVLPRDLIPRDQRRFVFDLDGAPRLLSREHPSDGEELPPRKFVVHRTPSPDASPYGRPLGSTLFWPVFFKRQGIGFWLTFADKFGSPTAVGKYPAGTLQAEQDKLLAALSAISQDAGIIVPEGMLVELLEASRSGSADLYERLARYLDEQISEAVLGETMSTTSAGAGLGSNQASVHNEVRLELAQADADLLSDTLNRTIVRWVIDYNLPGAGYPKIYRDFSEPGDLKARAERDQILVSMGYEPSDQYVTETYGEGWTKKAAPPPGAGVAFPPRGKLQPGTADPAAAEFADAATTDTPDANDLQSERLGADARAPLGAAITHLKRIVDHAESLEALRDDLLAAYGHLPMDDLQRVMQQAFAAADAAGRFEVAGEAG